MDKKIINRFPYNYNFIKTILNNRNVKIDNYLINCYLESSSIEPICAESRSIITFELMKFMKAKKRWSDTEISCSLRDFNRFPVIQMADHGEVMLHPNMIMNNYLSNYAANKIGLKFIFSQQCTRVKAITNKSKLLGSAIIPRSNGYLKIYSQGFDKLTKLSIACMNPVVTDFKFFTLEREIIKNITIPEIIKEFDTKRYFSATGFLEEINNHIWKNLNFRNKCQLVLFDEDFSCQCVATMLSGKTLLSEFFKNDSACMHLIKSREERKRSQPYSQLDISTDYFWLRENNSLKAMRLCWCDSGKLILVPVNSKGDQIPFSPEILSELLFRKVLYPDTTLSYITLSILPGIACLGGGSQSEYFPEIASLFSDAIDKFGINKRIKQKLHMIIKYSKLFYYGLLELNKEQRTLIDNLDKSSDLDMLIESLESLKLHESVGELRAFDYLEETHKLICEDNKRAMIC
ncbi:hypothetical protein [Brenneria goodwinii]|uniref:hypothetical protein n=1 Tax=Brenneria goodwinii TaxID=1109412 RepID=UPI0036EFFE32